MNDPLRDALAELVPGQTVYVPAEVVILWHDAGRVLCRVHDYKFSVAADQVLRAAPTGAAPFATINHELLRQIEDSADEWGPSGKLGNDAEYARAGKAEAADREP